jgi:hypothetical protein
MFIFIDKRNTIMLKKTLIEGRVLDKWLQDFYSANVDKKEKLVDLIKKTSPGLGNALIDWEKDFINLLASVKKIKEKNNQDTTKVDKLLKLARGY